MSSSTVDAVFETRDHLAHQAGAGDDGHVDLGTPVFEPASISTVSWKLDGGLDTTRAATRGTAGELEPLDLLAAVRSSRSVSSAEDVAAAGLVELAGEPAFSALRSP